MSLPVPYIQNYSIEFSRISGYYTKGEKKTHKKPAKRFGPFQISVAKTERGDAGGKRGGGKKPSSAPGAISMPRAHETP